MGLIKVAGLLVVLFAMYGCGSSKATGPSQNCVLNQDTSNSSNTSASVGDTTLNCTKSTDSHDDNSATE